MNNNLRNFLAYCYMRYSNKARLDKGQNDIHDTLVHVGFATLVALAILGCVALCFMIKPPEYYSTQLALGGLLV